MVSKKSRADIRGNTGIVRSTNLFAALLVAVPAGNRRAVRRGWSGPAQHQAVELRLLQSAGASLQLLRHARHPVCPPARTHTLPFPMPPQAMPMACVAIAAALNVYLGCIRRKGSECASEEGTAGSPILLVENRERISGAVPNRRQVPARTLQRVPLSFRPDGFSLPGYRNLWRLSVRSDHESLAGMRSP